MNNLILIYYGEYYVDSISYSINGFTTNPENVLKRVQIVTEKNNKHIIEDRYIIITDLFFILLNPALANDKSICTMSFYGKLDSINAIKEIPFNIESSNKQAYIIEWKPSATRIYSNILLLDIRQIIPYHNHRQRSIQIGNIPNRIAYRRRQGS